jgi:hypothetical protein
VIRWRTDGVGAASCSEPPAARARYADDPYHPEKTGRVNTIQFRATMSTSR